MADNAAYDITAELDPVEKLDDVQKKLEARRKEKQKSARQSQSATNGEAVEELEAKKEAERKKRADKAKREKEQLEQARRAREEELAASAWVTSSHKVRQKRVELLDKLYLRMKADEAFVGSKQEFYDEGLAMLEEKYAVHAKERSP